ncbi:MAG TPA: GDSL-type esterase/lipase family protein [Candidatus Limnocylindrales bacterium]|nr:GDSL-type esterase/lipase family protein [Candidatus Limnocylindrales bacterium]
MRRAVSILALLALVGGVAATGVAPAATADAASNRPQEYLALGDSLAFGYSPLVSPASAGNFIAYPDKVSAALRERLTNAACPGETSSHLIDLAGTDNNCGLWRANFPLHVAYSTTQLAFADGFLQSHPKTLVVSIDIGANDAQALVNACGGQTEVGCIQAGLPVMLATLSANLDTIYGHIRNLDGYHHKLVAVTTYSTNYGDPLPTSVISMVNQVVAERTLAWGGIVADGFGAFAAASAATGGDACAAGLLIAVSSAPLTCDSHPSPAGRDLLARAIVNALRTD